MEFIVMTAILAAIATIFPGFIRILAWCVVFPAAFLAMGSFVWVGVNLFTGYAFMGWWNWFWISALSGLPFGLWMAKDSGG